MKKDYVGYWVMGGLFLAFRMGAPFLAVLAFIFLALVLYVIGAGIVGLFRPQPPSLKKSALAPMPPPPTPRLTEVPDFFYKLKISP